jgi:hypothetical protein
MVRSLTLFIILRGCNAHPLQAPSLRHLDIEFGPLPYSATLQAICAMSRVLNGVSQCRYLDMITRKSVRH